MPRDQRMHFLALVLITLVITACSRSIVQDAAQCDMEATRVYVNQPNADTWGYRESCMIARGYKSDLKSPSPTCLKSSNAASDPACYERP